MFDFDDDLVDFEDRSPSIRISITRPGKVIYEYTSLTLKGDDIEELDMVLEFLTRAVNAIGFTYVDALRVDRGF